MTSKNQSNTPRYYEAPPHPTYYPSTVTTSRPWPQSSRSFRSIDGYRQNHSSDTSLSGHGHGQAHSGSREASSRPQPTPYYPASTTQSRSATLSYRPEPQPQNPGSEISTQSQAARNGTSQSPLERWQSESVLNSPWNAIESFGVTSPRRSGATVESTPSSSRRRPRQKPEGAWYH